MTGELQHDFDRRLSFDCDAFVLHLHPRPSIRRLVLKRILRIQIFDVQILLIEAEDRESPRNVLIVTHSDSRQAWLARVRRQL